MHSTVGYCASVWCRSAHTRLIDAALRIVTGCLRPTPADNTPIFAGIQPAEFRHSGATLSLGRRAMEPGHLLHSALTLSIECCCTAPQIETPICTRRTVTHQLLWQQHTCGALGGSPMERRVGGQLHKTPHFNSRHRYTRSLPGMTSHEESGSGLTASAPVSDVSAPACTNGVWPSLRPVSVAQKNKPSTMSSSNVRSIELPMDCTAWRFWTMRQPNGCSTPAPRSSSAKQWIREELAQTKEELAWSTSRFGETRYENVWTTAGFCDMKNLPRSLSRNARSTNHI